MALGGAGVAFAAPAKAPLFNPALLSTKRDGANGRATLSVHAGARLFDRGGFIDGVRHYQDSNAEAAFDSAMASFNRNVDRERLTAADFDRLSAATNTLLDDIEGLSNRPLRVGGSIGVALARPGPSGLAGFVQSYAVGGSIVDFAPADRALIAGVLDFGRSTLTLSDLFAPYVEFVEQNKPPLQSAYDTGGLAALEQELKNLLATSALAANADDLVQLLQNYHDIYLAGAVAVDDIQALLRLPDFQQELRSALELQGALVTEGGVSFSKRIGEQYGLAVGATLKIINFETVDYRTRIVDATSDNFAFRDHRAVFSDPNVDIGIAGSFAVPLQWGVVVRNLLARDYETVRGNIIRLRPQVRIGLAWEKAGFTVAADLDLTRNEPLGFDPDKRFMGIGIERRWSRWSVRGGLRHNIVDHTQLYALGAAVRIGRTRLEFSAAGANDTVGIALQLDTDL